MSGAARRQWLVLHLEAPMLSFGGVAIDNYGVTNDFPGLSMLTGLFANALDWQRTDREAHQNLQDRIIFAARLDHAPYHGVLQDVQNAKLGKNDKGWTTRGKPEGRAGDSYRAPHRRYRDYHPDAQVVTVLTVGIAEPMLEALAAALDCPTRPLFFGRKPCLPTRRINGGFVDAATAYEALQAVPSMSSLNRSAATKEHPALWPANEGPTSGALVDRTLALADIRNWQSGLHGGTRRVVEGRVSLTAQTGGGALA